jgi:hypothetical protein
VRSSSRASRMHAQKFIVPCPAIGVQSAPFRGVQRALDVGVVLEIPERWKARQPQKRWCPWMPSQVNPVGTIHRITDTQSVRTRMKIAKDPNRIRSHRRAGIFTVPIDGKGVQHARTAQQMNTGKNDFGFGRAGARFIEGQTIGRSFNTDDAVNQNRIKTNLSTG